MNNYDEKVWTLITRILTGEANSEEKEELRQWIDEDPKHHEFFSNIRSTWEEEPDGSVDASFLFDYESGLKKLRGKLDEEEGSAPKQTKINYSRSARPSSWKIAASIVLLIAALSGYMTTQFWEQSVVSYATTNIEQRIITLPDNSVVRLNKDSKIHFPEGLAGEKREIWLQGEAFFDVERNKDRPFVIHVNDALVKVLGTSFNVKEDAESEIIVAVKEGMVSFRRREKEEENAVKLTSGQLGLLTPDGDEVKVEQVPIENYLSWINDRLVFDSMPFSQVVKQLERIYGIECELQDSSLGLLRLTVYTERTHMKEVVNTIALTMNLSYRVQGNKVKWMRSKRED